MKKNPIVWWELATHNQEASVEFFNKVFEWDLFYDHNLKFYRTEHGSFAEKFRGGGIFTLKKPKLPFLALYIEVDDIENKQALIKKHGGFIVEEPFELSSGSKICLFNEPSGVTFAMYEPKKG